MTDEVIPIKNGKSEDRRYPFLLSMNKQAEPLTAEECQDQKGAGCDRCLSISVIDNTKSKVYIPGKPEKSFTVFVGDVPLQEMAEIVTMLAQMVGSQPQAPLHVRDACHNFAHAMAGNPMQPPPTNRGIIT